MSAHGRICKKCEVWKPYSQFYRMKIGKDGYKPRCKDCYKEENRGKADIIRAKGQERRYGVTPAIYAAIMEMQDGLCPMCDVDLNTLPTKLIHIEHCHETNAIRGIVCYYCNQLLGGSKDTITTLFKAAAYLIKSRRDGCLVENLRAS